MNNADQIFTDMNENFRYLHMGLPEDILRRKLSGDFKGALRLIDPGALADPKIPQAMKHSLTAIARSSAAFPLITPSPGKKHLPACGNIFRTLQKLNLTSG